MITDLDFVIIVRCSYREAAGGAPVKKVREYKDMEHEAHDVATANVALDSIGLTAEGECLRSSFLCSTSPLLFLSFHLFFFRAFDVIRSPKEGGGRGCLVCFDR